MSPEERAAILIQSAPPLVDTWSSFERSIAEVIRAAVAEEREACAKIAETVYQNCKDDFENAGDTIAERIRWRK